MLTNLQRRVLNELKQMNCYLLGKCKLLVICRLVRMLLQILGSMTLRNTFLCLLVITNEGEIFVYQP